MLTKRIDYLDTAKAYLIFLVILGHVLIVLNPGYEKSYFSLIQEFIYSFHMIAFFIIHGILFNIKKWKALTIKDFIISRIYGLVIPYFFFEIIGIFCRLIFFKQDIVTGIYNMLSVRCNVGADWFLIAMFFGSLLFIISVKYLNRICEFILTVICLILPMFMAVNQFAIVLGRALLAYAFIMIGYLLKKSFLSEQTSSLLWIVISLIITGIIAIINLKYGGNDFYTCTVHNPILLVVGGISGTTLIIGISHIISHKVFNAIGKHTLTIMGTHQLVIYACTALIPDFYGAGIGNGIILSVVIIVFEIPIVYLIDRYLPFLVGRKGNN